MNRDFLISDNEMFEIIRRIKESNNPIIETWKEHTRAEKVFRKNGYLYFCIKVIEPEIEIIPWDDTETN